MKYGIFLSHHEMRERPETLAYVLETTDEWVNTPEEVFNTKEAALAKLKENKTKYFPCICKMRGNGGVYYNCMVYFVAACEYRYEKDANDVTEQIVTIQRTMFGVGRTTLNLLLLSDT